MAFVTYRIAHSVGSSIFYSFSVDTEHQSQKGSLAMHMQIQCEMNGEDGIFTTLSKRGHEHLNIGHWLTPKITHSSDWFTHPYASPDSFHHLIDCS